MHLYPKRTVALAVGFALLAGYVDAIGFLGLGGFFVSFMSGNSTKIGVGLGAWNLAQVWTGLGLVGSFLLGVIGGSLVAEKFSEQRRQAVLILVIGLLGVSFSAHQTHFSTIGTVCQVLAMGALNAAFERGGEVSIGVTYTTGSLVKAGQRMAAAFKSGPRWAWVPYICLWLGLVSGAGLGAVAFARFGVTALGASVVYALLLLPVAHRIP